MGVHVTPVTSNGTSCLGLCVAWADSQFVMIVADRGVVSCGVIDVQAMERAGAAIAVARGTRDQPLKTVRDLLAARILEVTSPAAKYGVTPGMSGREALDALTA